MEGERPTRRRAAQVPAVTAGGRVRPANPWRPYRLRFHPALTGIRAIGISAVLAFHSNFRTLPGAWIFMSVFFVLSGYLITALIMSEFSRTDRFSIRGFYERRLVRLLPPLAIAVVGVAVYASFVNVFSAANRLWGDVSAAVFYYADFRSAFGKEPQLGFFAQAWSLSVEEQFYVVWAIAMFVLLRYRRKWPIYGVAIAGIVIGQADRLWLTLSAHHWTSLAAARVYYAPDARMDGLFLGCLVGLLAADGVLERWAERIRGAVRIGSVLGIGLIGYVIVTVTLASRSIPLYWLTVSQLAVAVIIVQLELSPGGWEAKVVGARPLVFVGDLSYTIYVVHWPVYVAISPFTVPWSYWPSELVRLAIILTVATASWYLVERPLMIWRRKRFTPPAVRGEDATAVAERPRGGPPRGREPVPGTPERTGAEVVEPGGLAGSPA